MKHILFLSLTCISLLFSSCGEDDIPGCTNPASDNYNSEANMDDGSCFIAGCTDPDASNYDPNATQSGGTCLYPGCTDIQSDQYNETANEDDGSCSTYFDRWTGSFLGNFNCSETLEQYVGEATMTFSKRDIPDNQDSMDVVLEFSLSEMPLSFSTVITRDSMYASAEFLDIAVDPELVEDLPVEIERIDLNINGTMGINEENNTIDGVLLISAVDLTSGFNFPLESTCMFLGEKQ